MQAFIEEYGLLLLGGVGETLFMTLVPTLFAYVLGLPMGVLLTITKPGGIAEAPRFKRGVRLAGEHPAQPAVHDPDDLHHSPHPVHRRHLHRGQPPPACP